MSDSGKKKYLIEFIGSFCLSGLYSALNIVDTFISNALPELHTEAWRSARIFRVINGSPYPEYSETFSSLNLQAHLTT